MSQASKINIVDDHATYSEIAAVDLGSNSFRLQFAKVVDDHLIFHDSMRESVRLGAGLIVILGALRDRGRDPYDRDR